jgi:hypothetical protein
MKVWPRATHLVFMRLFIVCSIAALLIRATHADAVEVDSVRVLAPPGASCPAAADVARELSSLLPQLSISSGEDVKPASTVAALAFNDADSYRVDLGSESRTFVDGNRRCTDRARTAAVFIAMALSPPGLPPDVTPDAPRNIAPPAQAPSSPELLSPTLSDSMSAPHLDPFLRASIAVYGASLVGTISGIAAWAEGAAQSRASFSCIQPVAFSGTHFNSHARPTCDDGYQSSNELTHVGIGLTAASLALGVVVGIPLTVVGARRNAAKRRAALLPSASGTGIGLATVGTW